MYVTITISTLTGSPCMLYVMIRQYSEVYSLTDTTKKLQRRKIQSRNWNLAFFLSLEVIPVCNCPFSCAFMNQLILCSPHGWNSSLGTTYNTEISLLAEKLVFHHARQKAIFPCSKMRTDVKARVTSWSSRGRSKASTQSESRQVGQPHLSAAPARPCFKSASAISDYMF